MLGELDDPTNMRMKAVFANLKKKKKTDSSVKKTVTKLSNVNEKLVDGLTVSLNVIVDIGKVLKNYHYFMDEVEELVSKMDSHSIITSKSIKDLKSLTDVALNNLNMNYNDQLDEILEAYKKNDMDSSKFSEFRKILHKGGKSTKTTRGKKKQQVA